MFLRHLIKDFDFFFIWDRSAHHLGFYKKLWGIQQPLPDTPQQTPSYHFWSKWPVMQKLKAVHIFIPLLATNADSSRVTCICNGLINWITQTIVIWVRPIKFYNCGQMENTIFISVYKYKYKVSKTNWYKKLLCAVHFSEIEILFLYKLVMIVIFELKS